jgi:uncharacterized protein (DUF1800 family)
MPRSPLLRHASLLVPLVLIALTQAALAQAPQLMSAVSRKTHGTVDQDIALPLAGGSGVECRTVNDVAGGMKLVLFFDKAIDAGAAAVTQGTAAVSAAPSFAANAMTIPLGGVANAQELTVTVSNVSAAGGPAGSASVRVRVLLGDANSNGSVSGADVSIVKSRVGFPVDGGSFRSDVNANGSVSGADVSLVSSMVGTFVAGGATQNTAPTISDVPDMSTESGLATAAIGFALGDAESNPGILGLSATSSNPGVIPATAVSFGGVGGNRTIRVTPPAGQTGTATITVTVSDGLLTASDTFVITVVAPTKLYIAAMKPQLGAISQGSGSSTLRLAGDEKSAIIRYQFGTLSSPKVAAHVHGPADPLTDGSAGILFDLDVEQQEDGSFLWTFPADETQRAQLVGYIKTGQTYINVHSSNYPGGEIKGFYALANGSTEFKKPTTVPAAPTAPADRNEATRFLIQATYGPSDGDVTDLMMQDYDTWITAQQQEAPTLLKPIMDQRIAASQPVNATMMYEAWWRASLTGTDQLRQRVAFALSQILVVSINHGRLNEVPLAVANYYDVLLKGAFGNYRQLIEDVTLSPAMGLYLDMRGSRKANTSTGTIPNENYPREVLQLFSIGVNKLHPDGTLKLDNFGLPIATYDQNVIIGFARTFTGWDWHYEGTTVPNPYVADYINPMSLIQSRHETAVMPGQTYSKLLLDGVTLPPNRNGLLDLKDALDNIFNHPNVGPFISRQLIQRLVTSNPSPGYVYRVARVFDGYRGDAETAPSAPRGDLGAVVRAILTDYEARTTTLLNTPGYGKLREPLLRNTAVIRAFSPTSVSGEWRISNTDGSLQQTPLRSPTVFNFFEPDFSHPGEIAGAGLKSPEFQITSETSAITSANFMRDGIYNGWSSATPNRDIKINLTELGNLSSNPDAMVDRVNEVLMAGQMPAAMKTIIVNHVKTIGATDKIGRARAAVHLTATSPQFCTQR